MANSYDLFDTDLSVQRGKYFAALNKYNLQPPRYSNNFCVSTGCNEPVTSKFRSPIVVSARPLGSASHKIQVNKLHLEDQECSSRNMNFVNVAGCNTSVSSPVFEMCNFKAPSVLKCSSVLNQEFVHQDFKEKLLFDVNKNFQSAGGSDRQKALENPDLIRISQKVPFVLMNSHADKTNKAYSRIFLLWKKWCSVHDIHRFLPSNPYEVSLFMIDSITKSKSAATAKMILPALTWAHRVAGLQSSLDMQYLRDISGGLQRQFSKPKKNFL
jgi:hypothetical protein